MPAYGIEFSGPTIVTDTRQNRAIDARTRAALDGRILFDQPLIEVMDDSLHEHGIRGGQMRLVASKASLRWIAHFTSPTKPGARVLKQLADEVDAQISDGAGEGGFDLKVGRRRLHLDPRSSRSGKSLACRLVKLPDGAPAARRAPSLLAIAQSGNAVEARELLARGARLEEVGKFEQTPIFVAVNAGNWPVVRELVKRGANLSHRARSGSQVLSIALMANAPSATIHLLIGHGADPRAIDNDGVTPLMWAANRGNLFAVRVLIAAGSDVDHQDANGSNALMFAGGSRRGRVEDILRTLLTAGANPRLRNEQGYDAAQEAEDQADGMRRLGDKSTADMQSRKAALLKRYTRRK